jgi:hypothetical protein
MSHILVTEGDVDQIIYVQADSAKGFRSKHLDGRIFAFIQAYISNSPSRRNPSTDLQSNLQEQWIYVETKEDAETGENLGLFSRYGYRKSNVPVWFTATHSYWVYWPNDGEPQIMKILLHYLEPYKEGDGSSTGTWCRSQMVGSCSPREIHFTVANLSDLSAVPNQSQGDSRSHHTFSKATSGNDEEGNDSE